MARMNVPSVAGRVTEQEAFDWAAAHGCQGERGGWIRSRDGKPLAQGYWALAAFLERVMERDGYAAVMPIPVSALWAYRQTISKPGRWVS